MQRIALISSILLLCINTQSFAVGVKRIIPQRSLPSNELSDAPGVLARIEKFRWACYTLNGASLVPCSFTFELLGLAGPEVGVTQACIPDATGAIAPDTCGNGGHPPGAPHPQRPKILQPLNGSGLVMYPGDTATTPNDEDLIVEGITGLDPDTINTLSVVSWDVSQVAGIYTWKSEVYPGDRRYFLEPDVFQDGSLQALGKVDVGVRDLKQLPPPGPGDGYELARGADDQVHTDAVGYAGTEDTINALPLIGKLFFFLTFRPLQINDLSLPKGGVFDYQFNWTNPHRSHREGRDTDINRDGVPCRVGSTNIYDTNFFAAVDMILTKTQRVDQKPSAIHCEDGGRKHIDTTSLIP